MNEYFFIYLIEILDDIKSFFMICSIASIIIIICIFICNCEYENFLKKNKKLKTFFWLLPIFIFINNIIPSTNKAYKIIGIGAVITYINNNEQIKKLPNNLIQYVNIQLEKEIKKEKNNETNNNR